MSPSPFFAVALALVGIGLVLLSLHIGGRPLGFIGFGFIAIGLTLAYVVTVRTRGPDN